MDCCEPHIKISTNICFPLLPICKSGTQTVQSPRIHKHDLFETT